MKKARRVKQKVVRVTRRTLVKRIRAIVGQQATVKADGHDVQVYANCQLTDETARQLLWDACLLVSGWTVLVYWPPNDQDWIDSLFRPIEPRAMAAIGGSPCPIW